MIKEDGNRTRIIAKPWKELAETYPWNMVTDIMGVSKRDMPEFFKTIARTDTTALQETLETLTEREQEVLELRYAYGMTLRDVGNKKGVSPERIRQIESKAIRKMRHPARARKYILPGRNQIDKLMEENRELQRETAELRQALEDAQRQEPMPKHTVEMPIEELDLSVRSYNCLRRAGCQTAEDVCRMTYDGLTRVRNLGRKSAFEIIERLKENGYRLQEDDA